MIGRRSFLLRAAPALLIAKPALAASVCTLQEPTETPLDRIHHHLKGLEQACADFYGRPPDRSLFREDLGVALVITDPPGLHKSELVVGLHRRL